jgi:hypothetical protein
MSNLQLESQDQKKRKNESIRLTHVGSLYMDNPIKSKSNVEGLVT